jgi:hypothetical protein
MAYQNSSGSEYGGYFTSYTSGSGKGGEEVEAGVGIGVDADMLGGYVHGDNYGLHVKGSRYAQYSEGDSYETGCRAVLHDTKDGKRVATYTPTSPSADVYTYGVGQLSEGKAAVQFDAAFQAVVSDTEPVIVTATAVGEAVPLCIRSVGAKSFAVASSPNVKSSVAFTWIAIGKRKGYEDHAVPEELLAPDFDARMEKLAHKDVDRDTNGEGMYLVNGKLAFGVPPLKAETKPPPRELPPAPPDTQARLARKPPESNGNARAAK